MKNVKPYVYLLIHRETGQFYFGFRMANKETAEIDLKSYHSSSALVKELGPENFDRYVSGEFESGDEAYDVEQSLISLNFDNPLNLNRHHRISGSGRFKTPSRLTDSWRSNLSEAAKRRPPMKPEIRAKISRTKTGRKSGPASATINEARLQGRLNNAVPWEITHPEGSVTTTSNLSEFCREHGLNVAHMSEVAKGSRKHHKKFKVRRSGDGGRPTE